MGHWVRMLMVLTLIRCGGHDEKKERKTRIHQVKMGSSTNKFMFSGKKTKIFQMQTFCNNDILTKMSADDDQGVVLVPRLHAHRTRPFSRSPIKQR